MTNQIEKVLKKYLNKNHSIDFQKLSSITNYLDQADENTISFYHITEKETALENFVERFERSDSGLVILWGEYNHPKIICVSEKDFYELQISLCDILLPLKDISLIGITGTNGKTSSANFVTSILNQNNYPAVSLGTLGLVYKNNLIHDFKMTTPGYIEIRNAIHMLPPEVRVLVMEVSSHGLKQNRLGNLKLDVAGWTNFTQDHLDYHKTMDDYFEAKSLIREITKSNIKIPNNTQLKELLDKNKFEYELVKPFEEIFSKDTNDYFNIKYHRENFELAYSLAEFIIGENIKVDINKVDYPEGRFEIYNINQRMFVVDYAHTPDALEKLLSEIKANFKDKRLKLVFGCGGDRDTQKRSQMGVIASNLADMIYVTDDNPRTEDPKLITKMIADAILIDHKVINDRAESIKTAYDESQPGDIIVIAGKGHEKYQEINGKRSYFSDQDIVKSLQ